MKRTSSWNLRWAMCLLGGTLAASSCATDLRDAVTTGAITYVSDTTTQFLTLLLDPGAEE